MDKNILPTEFEDTPPIEISDIANDLTEKLYIYEMVDAKKSKKFIQEKSTSIISISQDALKFGIDNIELDDNGFAYIDILKDKKEETKETYDLPTSFMSNDLKNTVVEFNSFSNVNIDLTKFGPIVGSLHKPFNDSEFRLGNQDMFLLSDPNSHKEQTDEKIDKKYLITKSTNNEYFFKNVHILKEKYKNSSLLFIERNDFSQNPTTFEGKQGISLGLQPHTLLHSIKGRGITSEYDNSGKKIAEGYGDIDLISEEKFAPFKFTPTSINDKLSLYADWFDYDTVLPFVYIEKFKVGAPLASIITNTEDREMIEDMLAISAGFASSWDTAPVITSGNETGKIQPTFRVGHAGIKISVIAGHDPIKVIDGIFENHIRKYPEFETTLERYQPTKAVLNALSRYLYSSYAIGKGQNSYNQIYLPWYLEPYFDTPIEFDKKIQIANPDKGLSGQVDTFVLNDGIKFQAKSVYFHDEYSSDVISKGKKQLELPKSINFSSQKLVQTDRKLTLPEVPDEITPINKMPLPGDINTNSSNSLQYIWYLPIQNQTLFEEFMLNKLTAHQGPAVGTTIDVQLPRTPGGTIWDQTQANNAIIAKYPGSKITTATILSQEEEEYKDHTYTWEGNPNGTRLFRDGVLFSEYEGKPDAEIIARDIGVPVSGLVLTGGTGSPTGTYTVKLKYTRFSVATVEIVSQAGTSFSYASRQILFDKQSWKDFLVKFNLVPNSFVPYSFDERPNWKINKVDELTIQSVWGDEIEIIFGASIGERIKIPLYNNDDESIATQRFIFT